MTDCDEPPGDDSVLLFLTFSPSFSHFSAAPPAVCLCGQINTGCVAAAGRELWRVGGGGVGVTLPLDHIFEAATGAAALAAAAELHKGKRKHHQQQQQ